MHSYTTCTHGHRHTDKDTRDRDRHNTHRWTDTHIDRQTHILYQQFVVSSILCDQILIVHEINRISCPPILQSSARNKDQKLVCRFSKTGHFIGY